MLPLCFQCRYVGNGGGIPYPPFLINNQEEGMDMRMVCIAVLVIMGCMALDHGIPDLPGEAENAPFDNPLGDYAKDKGPAGKIRTGPLSQKETAACNGLKKDVPVGAERPDNG
jgi:hypothetical protein